MQSSAPSSGQVLGPRYPDASCSPNNLELCLSVFLYLICSCFCIVLIAFPRGIPIRKPTAEAPWPPTTPSTARAVPVFCVPTALPDRHTLSLSLSLTSIS